MKKKLAIFDFDSTIKEHEHGFTLGGRSKLFPGQQIPEDLFTLHEENLLDAIIYPMTKREFN